MYHLAARFDDNRKREFLDFRNLDMFRKPKQMLQSVFENRRTIRIYGLVVLFNFFHIANEPFFSPESASMIVLQCGWKIIFAKTKFVFCNSDSRKLSQNHRWHEPIPESTEQGSSTRRRVMAIPIPERKSFLTELQNN